MKRLVLLAALVPIAIHAAPPQRVALEYEMSHNDSVMADMKETLEHDGKSYRITSEIRGRGIYALAGTISRSSQGSVGADGLRPAEFQDRRGERRAAVKFDWANQTVVQENKGKSETQPLPAHAQDRLSFLWTFAFSPPKGNSIEAPAFDGRGAPAQYRFTVAGKETLKTKAGDIETLHLIKQQDEGDKRGTEIWLAFKRNYLPVRVLVVEKDGARIDQIVTRIEG